jgi:cytoskeletal protein RodZ
LPEGTAPPRSPVAIGAAALLVVLALLVGVFVATRGGGDDGVTARPSASTSSKAASSKATPTESVSATATAAETKAPDVSAKRPPTLNLTLTGPSFVTVRLPNGRTVVSRLFRKGEHRSFDQKELRVLLGNSSAVQVSVNGKPRKPGRKGQVDTFTVRRK